MNTAFRRYFIGRLLRYFKALDRPREILIESALFSLLHVCLCLSAYSQTTSMDISPPGRLIDIGGYKLHIWCTGVAKDNPTIILLHGLGSSSIDWTLIQPKLSSDSIRVCSCDRAGGVWSDPGPVPRGPLVVAHELKKLLQNSGESAPYVLVGHSWGGLIARVYTSQYPDEVSGMVLVDATNENTYWEINDHIVVPRLMTVSSWTKIKPRPEIPRPRSTPPAKLGPPFDVLPIQAQEMRKWARSQPRTQEMISGGDVNDIRSDLMEVYKLTRKDKSSVHPLGNMPLILISAKRAIGSAIPERYTEYNVQANVELSRYSHYGKHVVAKTDNHFIQITEPKLVVDSIIEIIMMIKKKNKKLK